VLETAAPLLEVLRLCVNRPPPPGMRLDVAVPLPSDFLTTHSRLHHLFVNGTVLSSWAIASGVPLASLTLLSVHAPGIHRAR